MVVRSIARCTGAWSRQPQNALISRAAHQSFHPRQARSAHSLPVFGDVDHERRLETEGIPGLFSPEAYDVAWTKYQQFMLDRLNTILANDPGRAQWKLKDVILNTAREPNLAPTFNYASMAHNNHFFFSGLTRDETEPPQEFEKAVNASFGSIHALRDSLLSTAAGMFGPGFVWLVQEESPSTSHPAVANSSSQSDGHPSKVHLRLLTTYLAGSPYPGAHTRQQGQDMNVQNLKSAEDFYRQTRLQNSAGSFGRASAGARGMGGIAMDPSSLDDGGDSRRFGGADLIPVLCVNTWQHCYLHDYGVAGKREYLARWWDRVNWSKVWANCIERETYGLRR